ncbi:hypothetical protein BH11ACT8_BH11ACT8_10770 [soil metagenome]
MTTPSRRVAMLLLTGAVAVSLAGCSSSDDDATSDPTTAPSSTSAADAPSSATTTEAAPTPVAFDFDAVDLSISCTPFTEYVQFEQFTTDADVVLRSVDVADGSTGITVGRTWVSDDKRQAISSGNLAVNAKGTRITDEAGWAGRTRLSGAAITAGTTYTVFATLSIGSGADVDSFVVSYRDATGAPGVATWPLAITRESGCSIP